MEPVSELSAADIRRLDRIGYASWPALEEVYIGGWCVGSSGVYTRRANCVNPRVSPTASLSFCIAEVEAHYASRDQRPVFRMTRAAQPEGLDAVLASRGYGRRSETVVMLLRGEALLAPKREAERAAAGHFERSRSGPSAAWWQASCSFSKVAARRRADYEAILANLREQKRPCTFGAWVVDDQIRSVALGVYFEGLTSFHQVATDPEMRGRGYANRLMRGLLSSEPRPDPEAEAVPRPAEASFMLSVEADNAPARRLYERLGFREVYRYWYREG